MAIVYILTNPAFENYVKIGLTTNLPERLRSLDNTSVPLPFRCVFAVEVEDEARVERLMHQAFADHRVRPSREFFEIDPQRAIAALKLTGGKDVTPRDEIVEDDTDITAIASITQRSRKTFRFPDADVKVGDILVYSNDPDITAEVVGDRKILFEGGETSLSAAALILLHRDGFSWKSVNGWRYWMLDGETMSERWARVRAADGN